MKKLLAFFLVAVMVLGLVGCAGSGGQAQAEDGLQAGFGRENITPLNYQVHLQGGDWKSRISEGYLDYLYTTCIAMKQGEDTVLLFTMDVKVATDNFVDEAKAAVSKATGVPEIHILMNATHTHSGVAIRYSWEGVQVYKQEFNAACAKAAQDAIADLSAAEIYAGSTEATGMANVRHYLMKDGTYAGSNFGSWESGIVDHVRPADCEMQLVKLQRAAEDKKDILLMSFPSHATFNEHGNVLSADFPGPTRDYVEANSDCLAAFFQGASGDQTPGSHIEGRAYSKDYREYGQKLGQFAVEALPTLTAQADGGITVTTKEYVANTNQKGLDKLVEARTVKDMISELGKDSEPVKAAMKELGFHSTIQINWMFTRAELGPTKSMNLTTLTVGDLAFVLAPYEMFAQSGQAIKTRSPYENTFLITLAEGSFNYLPTSEAFDYECYESHCSYFAQGTAEALVEEYLGMLQSHKDGGAAEAN